MKMEMPDVIYVRGMPKTDPTTFIVDPANYYGDALNDTYHHDRILKAKDARIAELEAILQARGE